jgi:hypothetical protein
MRADVMLGVANPAPTPTPAWLSLSKPFFSHCFSEQKGRASTSSAKSGFDCFAGPQAA